MNYAIAQGSRQGDIPRLEGPAGIPLLPSPTSLSLWDVVALALKRRFRLILAFIVPVIASVLLAFLLPPTYRAQTSLVVGTGPEYLAQGDGASTMTAPQSTKQEFINTEIELLTSLAVAQTTINRVGINNIYPGIAAAGGDAARALDAAVRRFRSRLRVDPVKLSNLINVTFDYSQPREASRVLDQFIASYQDMHAKVFATRRAHSYEETIARDTAELEKLEHERAEVKAKSHIFDLVQQRQALIQQRVDAERHLQDTIDMQTKLRDRLTYLTSIRPEVPTDVRSVQTDKRDETVHARQMLLDLEQKEIILLGTYNPDSVVVQRVRQQIETMRRIVNGMQDTMVRVSTSPSPIATAIDQEVINARAELPPLDAQKTRYEALIATIGNQLREIESGDVQLRILDAHIAAQNDNLREMRRLYDQARAEDEMELAKVTSVVQTSPSITPDKPIAPNKLFYIVGGTLLGLFSAAGVLVIGVVTNRTFISEESLERRLGLPVLGSVPLRRVELATAK